MVMIIWCVYVIEDSFTHFFYAADAAAALKWTVIFTEIDNKHK